MLGLAIHTSSPQLGLMLKSVNSEDGGEQIARHQVWDLGREVSSQLHAKLIEFMAPSTWQELSFVAVAKGPGGFTGTRVGVVAARTLAQQLDIPLFGVSSLAAIAAQKSRASDHEPASEPASEPVTEIAVTLPAKREAVYGAIYRRDSQGDLLAVRPDEVVPEADWQAAIARWPQDDLGSINVAAGIGTAESVTGVMALAEVRWAKGDRPHWSSVMPFYGQHPVHR